MDIFVKNIVKDATTTFNTFKQLTEESLGMSEVTQLDEHLQHLLERADASKTWTEKIIYSMEIVLSSTPYYKVENYLHEMIFKKKLEKMSDLQYVSMSMINAGHKFGPDDAYGSALIKVGLCQRKLGEIEESFVKDSSNCFVQPLKKFLECEMATIMKERITLNYKRLELDASKNQVKKAKSMLGRTTAERQLDLAQSSFDHQMEIMKVLLEEFSNSQVKHLRYLHEFVEAQARYYAQSHATMQDLQRELAGTCQPSPLLRVNNEDVIELTSSPSQSQNTSINPPLAGSSYVTATFDTDVSKV